MGSPTEFDLVSSKEHRSEINSVHQMVRYSRKVLGKAYTMAGMLGFWKVKLTNDCHHHKPKAITQKKKEKTLVPRHLIMIPQASSPDDSNYLRNRLEMQALNHSVRMRLLDTTFRDWHTEPHNLDYDRTYL